MYMVRALSPNVIYLLSYSHSSIELPSPTLAGLPELKVICTKFYRQTVPTELGYSYDEIRTMDDVSVNLLPEKKGTVFKHNEYMVESKVGIPSIQLDVICINGLK